MTNKLPARVTISSGIKQIAVMNLSQLHWIANCPHKTESYDFIIIMAAKQIIANNWSSGCQGSGSPLKAQICYHFGKQRRTGARNTSERTTDTWCPRMTCIAFSNIERGTPLKMTVLRIAPRNPFETSIIIALGAPPHSLSAIKPWELNGGCRLAIVSAASHIVPHDLPLDDLMKNTGNER